MQTPSVETSGVKYFKDEFQPEVNEQYRGKFGNRGEKKQKASYYSYGSGDR